MQALMTLKFRIKHSIALPHMTKTFTTALSQCYLENLETLVWWQLSGVGEGCEEEQWGGIGVAYEIYY